MGSPLDEADVASDPIEQFKLWMDAAIEAKALDPTAMTLATADGYSHPSARIMLLKDVDNKGFTFFTNYISHKGDDLKSNPNACLMFFWGELVRQVRINGSVEKVSREDAEAYFLTRPYDSQIGAWASNQSEAIADRATLEQKFEEAKARFPEGETMQTPPEWGGYLLTPTRIEFWQGRMSRLHDRIEYTKLPGGSWTIKRLSP